MWAFRNAARAGSGTFKFSQLLAHLGQLPKFFRWSYCRPLGLGHRVIDRKGVMVCCSNLLAGAATPLVVLSLIDPVNATGQIDSIFDPESDSFLVEMPHSVINSSCELFQRLASK